MENRVGKEKEQSLSHNELIIKYQYLVTKIAKQFKDIPDSRENLEEVGYLGLLNAVHLYDKVLHKVDFKTYAQILITEEMHQYLLNHNHRINCPDWLIELNKQVNDFVIQYREKFQRFPQISDISSHFNITDSGLQEVLKARDSLRETYLSLYQESKSELDFLKPDLSKVKSQNYQSFKLPIEDLIILRRSFKKIREIKEGIIYYLFILDLNQTKLARMLGISSEKGKQIKEELLQNLP
ncbi:MAG: hypothetical protein PHI72_01330 [Atribacterota bacterium]|jgi:RNA polymerase sigma-B factor|nr:hypothetical protein [Atribacterota bacterium]MDD4895927.1 hypothetical protein [Atribacterota bacterium]MDD5638053.1 hypothetical protein [Atribacterota bacterium]